MNSATSVFGPEISGAGPVATPKVGDILFGTYGYEACIPTWAKVVGVTGKSVKVVEIDSVCSNYRTGGMEWTATPQVDSPIGEVMTKKVVATENGYRVKWSSYQNLYLTNKVEPFEASNYH